MSILKFFSKSSKDAKQSDETPTVHEVPITINAGELVKSFGQGMQNPDFQSATTTDLDQERMARSVAKKTVSAFEFSLTCPRCNREQKKTVGFLIKEKEVHCVCSQAVFVVNIIW